MKKTTIALLLGSALGMTACSTTQSSADVARDMVAAQKIRDKASEESSEKRQAVMEKEISQVPGWAVQTPSPDEEGVYAIGMGGSDNLRLSIRKAFLDGEYGLARAMNQMVSGSERSYSKDTNGHGGHEEYTALVDSLVNSVPVAGLEIIKQETKPVSGLYNTYVLLKLPYKEINRALQSRESGSQNETVKEAFAELYARLDKAEKKAALAAATPPLTQPVTTAKAQDTKNGIPSDTTKVLQTIVLPEQPSLNTEVR